MITLVWISRLRVNGGFLAGLDVELSPGLNVVIGPRGVGKTTMLELIRHALGTSHPDEAGAKTRQAAVDKLLGSGEVILDLQGEFDAHHVVVDSAGRGRTPETGSAALMLGQNELERIASSPESRLNLIDLRAVVTTSAPRIDHASGPTAEMAQIRENLEGLTEVTNRRGVLLSDREEYAKRERDLLSEASTALAQQRERLRNIEEQIVDISSQIEMADTARNSFDNALNLQVQVVPEIEAIRNLDVGVALAATLDPALPQIQSSIDSVLMGLSALRESVFASRRTLSARQTELRLEAEPIRQYLETAEAGLGQVTAQIRNIDSEISKIDRQNIQIRSLQERYSLIKSQRDAKLDEFETWQESVFEARKQIAESVSGDLQQRVTVSVQHLADSTVFKNSLETLLQGSGLQFRSIALSIAKNLLPRQFLTIVENSDSESLAANTDIAIERASRVIAHLQNIDSLTKLSEIHLEDRIDFKLLDGSLEKSVEDLSTGQKCAVTLPIVLTERARLLILDQPEDHLDNAYLVDNVVGALDSRSDSGGQTIVATHNANIPVLGSADLVISMKSNGVNGFIAQSGRFDEPQIVDVITSLMEGGRTAFKRRSEFYDEYGENDD